MKPFGNLSVLDNVMIGALTRVHAVSAAREAARRVIATCRLEAFAESRARSLPIGLRKRLVSERIRGQNRIRGLLVCQGLPAPRGARQSPRPH